MAQFDVYPNPAGGMGDAVPYVLDMQSDQLVGLPTRMIAPLARPEDFQPLRRLNPIIDVEGERLAVMTHLMAAVPRDVLQSPVASLGARRDDIVAALDFLFTGI
jgi:toxin CcdB